MSVHMIYYKDGQKMMLPVLSREEYMAIRNGGEQKERVKRIRQGEEGLKHKLVQMNYSCLPNEDGTLKGSTKMSTTVGMDIDHIKPEEMQATRDRILSKKDELGLLMLEESARGAGYHLAFRRRPELSQEDNLRWASNLLEVEYDAGAKDITRVFFTTSSKELLFLSEEIFDPSPEPTPIPSPKEGSQNGGENNSKPAVSQPPLPLERAGERLFKGIPYASIINAYWRLTGGEPAEGERNVKLHKLAVNLRAICDNKKEVLMQVMPRYGLSEAELKSIVDSACKEEPKGISKVIQSIIEGLTPTLSEGEGENAEDSDADNVQCSMLNVQWKRLPKALRTPSRPLALIWLCRW